MNNLIMMMCGFLIMERLIMCAWTKSGFQRIKRGNVSMPNSIMCKIVGIGSALIQKT